MSKSFEEIGRHSPETLRAARAIANRDSHLTADENLELKAKVKTPLFTFKVFKWTFTIYKA